MSARLRKPRAGGENVGDLHAAVDALIMAGTSDEEVSLAVRCVNRHTSGTGTFDVLDMLGLPPVLLAVKPLEVAR